MKPKKTTATKPGLKKALTECTQRTHWPDTYYSTLKWVKNDKRPRPLWMKQHAGNWLVECRYKAGTWKRPGEFPETFYVPGPCKMRYLQRGVYVTVMTARGVIAWENMRELVEHFHRRGHRPDLRPISCVADHPRPRWMGPPPPVKAGVSEAGVSEIQTLTPA